MRPIATLYVLVAMAAHLAAQTCAQQWTEGLFPSNAVDGHIQAFAEFDDGTGPALFAGGTFANAGGVPAACIAKWNGATWSALGSGVAGNVNALVVFDDGNGPA